MDFTGKKNANKAEEILKKNFEHHGCISGNNSRFHDVLIQTDAENGPIESDLLADNHDAPVVRSDPDRDFTIDELQQLDDMNCESAFESVNDLFPALERNGTEIRNNLDWDFNDQTSDVIASNTATQ